HQPPTVMRNACYDLIAWRIPNPFTGLGGGYYAGLSNRGYVCGHRDVGSTACPGDIWYGYIGTNLSGGEARTAINQRIVGTHSTIIVDNANAGFTCSANWATGTSSTDKYGTNYRWRSTQAISDTAQFSASLPSSGTWTVYAWWPQGTNRTPTAPYIVYYSSGSQTKSMNQQVNGGKWNTLGSWSMNSGSNKVKISCWTGTGYVIMADAVKWYK
ncbi:hypothetical protein JW926_02730, partial [Candidatus Sumerlaeota bacterium]|nr:hypothetical protein [Candidatus Sumerlaeota bacterium]